MQCLNLTNVLPPMANVMFANCKLISYYFSQLPALRTWEMVSLCKQWRQEAGTWELLLFLSVWGGGGVWRGVTGQSGGGQPDWSWLPTGKPRPALHGLVLVKFCSLTVLVS